MQGSRLVIVFFNTLRFQTKRNFLLFLLKVTTNKLKFNKLYDYSYAYIECTLYWPVVFVVGYYHLSAMITSWIFYTISQNKIQIGDRVGRVPFTLARAVVKRKIIY